MKALQKLLAAAGFRQTRLSVTSFGPLFSKTPKSSFAAATHHCGGEFSALLKSRHLCTISDASIDDEIDKPKKQY